MTLMSHKISQLQPIVSCDWLARRLDNPQVAIADCRFRLTQLDWGYQQYLLGHIPGAYYLNLDRDLSAPVQKHGGRHPLPNLQQLAHLWGAMGITLGETWVVAYDDARFAFTARLWWLLRYCGHEQVALLDGGWSAWQAGGYPVTDVQPAAKSGKFLPKPQQNWIVDIEEVKARQGLPSVVLIDSREGDRYRGEREPIDPIAGHIPGAVNSPWIQVSNERGFLLPLPEQQRLWSEWRSASEILVYCGSGVTACVNLFSLELAAISTAKLYPGGWSDWCSYLRA